MVAISDVRRLMIEEHAEHSYYEHAESAEWLEPFWGEASPFLRMFNQLDLTNALELACGRGRHTAQAIERMGTITLVDANASNIAACRERFSAQGNVKYVVNNGSSLSDIRDSACSAVFSYDAMVHFEAIDVISYISEIGRVLRPGGRALLHYSNNDVPGISPFEDAAWRNYFSRSMMIHFTERNGLRPLEDILLHWGGRDDLDGLILLEKTAS